MRLQEEYLHRHNLDIPIIYHTKNTSVILRLRGRPQIVLNIEWAENQQHPGIYNLKYLTPVHNGYAKNVFFDEMNSDYICSYQEYPTYIARWSKNLEFDPVSVGEVDLAIFEMFLLCYDRWLTKPWLDMAYKVVDITQDVKIRIGFLRDFISQLLSKEWLIFRTYENEFERFKYNYADWLVELIVKNKVKNESSL